MQPFVAGWVVLALAVWLHGVRSGFAENQASALQWFENQVRPVLARHCHRCHGGQQQKSRLRLDSRHALLRGGKRGPAVVPGRPGESRLIEAVRRSGGLKMPPQHALQPRQVAALVKWVEQGAPFPEPSVTNRAAGDGFWSFRPLRAPTPPAGRGGASERNAVDLFVQARLEPARLTLPPRASKRTLLRRACFDLTGLPPTPAEAATFLEDPSPDGFARLVDRFLATPAYGERWGRHWLDVVRYADTAGETADFPVPEAYRYRNWVIAALNADKPFDAFIQEQVAGDLLSERLSRGRLAAADKTQSGGFDPSLTEAVIFADAALLERCRELVTATGMLAISRRFGFSSDADHHLTIQDTIDTLGQSVLGLSLGCARCHDHKYDPIGMADYYAWYGIFASTSYAYPGSEGDNRPRDMAPVMPLQRARQRKAAFDAEMKRVSTELVRLAARRVSIENELRPLAALVAEDPQGGAPWNPFLSSIEERLLVDFVANENGHQGYHVLRPQGRGIPLLGVNTSERTLRIPGVVPAGALVVHPDSNDGTGVAWRSPIEGEVQVTGLVGDVHDCGNGVRWYLDHLRTSGFQSIATGKVGRSGVQDLAAAGAPRGAPLKRSVRPGDLIQLVISMDGDLGCDLTRIELKISHLAGDREVWDLSREVVPDLHQEGRGNPHSDQLGNPDSWFFYAVPPELRQAWATAPQLTASQRGASRGRARELKAELDETLTALALLSEKQLLMKERGPYEAVYGVVEGKAGDVRIHRRGDPDELGEQVPRRNLQLLGGEPLRHQTGSGRASLAEWLTRPANPLTARVKVNRIWQHHFGHGLVRTENDFGARGERPTHPQLLDWLASQLVRFGWSIKRMHRLIMGSASYQQRSRNDDQARSLDPDGKRLWGFPRRRLSAEEFRDALLLLGGHLDRSSGRQHPFPPVDSWNFTQHGPFYGLYPTRQRSIYLMQQRLKRHPFLALFDGADPNASTARRTTTTVPTQALYLMNDPFVHASAKHLAEHLRGGRPVRVDDWISAAYQRVLVRRPSADERETARDFVRAYAREFDGPREAKQRAAEAALARTLLIRNEFLFVD